MRGVQQPSLLMIIAFARGGWSFLLRICASIVSFDREKEPQPNSPPPPPTLVRSALPALTQSARSRNKAGRSPCGIGRGSGPPCPSPGLEKNTKTPGPTASGNREVKRRRGFFPSMGWWERGFAKLELSAEGWEGGGGV